MTRRPIVTVASLALVTAVIVTFQILSIVESTRHATALEAAQSYSNAISAIRSYYSSVVVPPATDAGVHVTHDYHDIDGAIPLPATLTIELGERMSATESNGQFRLLSAFPFPWRTTGGVRDAFELDALSALHNGEVPYFARVEVRHGRPELRLAQPVRMTESCVACHNNHPQSPRADWKAGDIRGIQTVSVPVPDFLASPTSDGGSRQIFEHFAVVIAILLAALGLIGSMLFGLKGMVNRQRRLLEIAKIRNKQLAAARIEAESADRMKTRFLATMSHELRTPLNAVIGFSEAMMSDVHGRIGNPHYVEFVGHINQAGQRLLEIINRILDLSRIEAGEFQVRKTEIDLANSLDRVLDTFASDPDAAALSWKVEIDPALPHLFASEREVREVLRNLIENAIKFTPAGGSIEIRAQAMFDGSLEIAVEDSGIGIAESDVAIAMEPFAQVDGGLDRQAGGTGLGLPLSRRYIEILGGRLSLHAREGGGTSVRIRFPQDCVIQPVPESSAA